MQYLVFSFSFQNRCGHRCGAILFHDHPPPQPALSVQCEITLFNLNPMKMVSPRGTHGNPASHPFLLLSHKNCTWNFAPLWQSRCNQSVSLLQLPLLVVASALTTRRGTTDRSRSRRWCAHMIGKVEKCTSASWRRVLRRRKSRFGNWLILCGHQHPPEEVRWWNNRAEVVPGSIRVKVGYRKSALRSVPYWKRGLEHIPLHHNGAPDCTSLAKLANR